MTTPFPSPTVPEPLRFSIVGRIATWDPFGRWLRIGERNFWVAPGLTVAGLIPGAMVTIIGHQEDLTARWIVTELTFDLSGKVRAKLLIAVECHHADHVAQLRDPANVRRARTSRRRGRFFMPRRARVK